MASKEIFYKNVQKAKGLVNQTYRDFSTDLSIGESFENYIIDVINQSGVYKAIKLEFDSELYHTYNHVDILVYKEDKPYCCFDAKCLTCEFKKALQFTGIPSHRCMALDLFNLKGYQKNEIPTFLIIYHNLDNPLQREGFYVKNVKEIQTDNVLQQQERSGRNSYKLNVDNQDFIYYESLEEILH